MITIDCQELCLNRITSKRETVIVKEVIDQGYGFKIKLLNVATVKAMGEPCISVYYTELAKEIVKILNQKEKLTKAEDIFMRSQELLNIMRDSK